MQARPAEAPRRGGAAGDTVKADAEKPSIRHSRTASGSAGPSSFSKTSQPRPGLHPAKSERAGPKEPGLRGAAQQPRGATVSLRGGARQEDGTPPLATLPPSQGRGVRAALGPRRGAGVCRRLPPVWGPVAPEDRGPVVCAALRPIVRAMTAASRRVFHLQPCGGCGTPVARRGAARRSGHLGGVAEPSGHRRAPVGGRAVGRPAWGAGLAVGLGAREPEPGRGTGGSGLAVWNPPAAERAMRWVEGSGWEASRVERRGPRVRRASSSDLRPLQPRKPPMRLRGASSTRHCGGAPCAPGLRPCPAPPEKAPGYLGGAQPGARFVLPGTSYTWGANGRKMHQIPARRLEPHHLPRRALFWAQPRLPPRASASAPTPALRLWGRLPLRTPPSCASFLARLGTNSPARGA